MTTVSYLDLAMAIIVYLRFNDSWWVRPRIPYHDADLLGFLVQLSVQHQLHKPLTKLDLTLCSLALCSCHGFVTLMRNRHIGNDGNNGDQEKQAGMIVPKPRPPYSTGCESRSPKEAPSGRVRI